MNLEVIKGFYQSANQLSGERLDILKNSLSTFSGTRASQAAAGLAYYAIFSLFMSQNRVVLNEEPDLNNEDLLNYAATQTLLNSGRVFALPPHDFPVKSDLAAILRCKNRG